jgi:uncharacterized protein (DUF1499 family)
MHLRVESVMFFLTAAVVVLFFVSGAILSLASREGTAAGLLDGRLHPCPGTPNCVCSEVPQETAFVEPLVFEVDADTAWVKAQMAVTEMGGEISHVANGYLAATYQTALFRFVDDVELRLDREGGAIHIRSASRVGRSDLGANRKRVEAIRRRFTALASR